MSYSPGRVEILWKNYLIQTNLLGIIIFFFSFLILFYFLISFVRKVREFPDIVKNNRNKKYLKLGNEALDNLALDLVLGDSESIEKNTRKLKKYTGNNIFSTFMFFFSSLTKNDLPEAKRYLEILGKIEKTDYLYARSKALFFIKEGNLDSTVTFLMECCGKYSKDFWFFEKLSSLHISNGKYDKALENLGRFKDRRSNKIKKLEANLKILAGGNILDALKTSNLSIFVIIKSIRHFIDNSEYKKAAKIIEQSWKNFYCFEIIETFIDYKHEDQKDSLKRYKLISKFLQSTFKFSDESKYSLAYCAYKAQIWGESQNFLEQIPNDKVDERVYDLYKKLANKSSSIECKEISYTPKQPPVWNCGVCNLASKKWKFMCENCQSVDSFIWKTSIESSTNSKSNKFFNDLIKNPLRHFPKMQR